MTRHNRRDTALVLLAGLVLAVSVLRLLVGEAMPRDGQGGVDWAMFARFIELRADRVLMGLVVGAALGVSGTILQALLRNPLASPYILGVSSGAALGVMVCLAGWLWFLGPVATPLAAFTGASATMAMVYAFAQKRGCVDPIGLLLVGVIVNALNGAAIMFINYLNPNGLRSDMVRWMMGSLDEGVSRATTLGIGAVVLLGTWLCSSLGRAMDAGSFSDSEARSMGVNIHRMRLTLFSMAGLMTAGSVMIAGPIGFVGLIAPHLVRLLIGPMHGPLVIGSALMGAALVVLADAAVKYVAVEWQIGQMPLGVITALVGGPFFIAMLRPQLGRTL